MKADALVEIATEEQGPYFVIPGEKKPVRVRVDFSKRLGIGLKSDLLARAIGWKRGLKLRVLDATAGLCRDSFHLASLGCEVTALEQNEILFRVVSAHVEKLNSHINLELVHEEAVAFLKSTSLKFDAIYLDPMFPEKKKSAKSGKESELLKLLAKPPSARDEQELLAAARRSAKRVVVKRPSHAPSLADAKPQAEFAGKAVRYDVYFSVGS